MSVHNRFQERVMIALKNKGYIGIPSGGESTFDEYVVRDKKRMRRKIKGILEFKIEKLYNNRPQKRVDIRANQVENLEKEWEKVLYYIIETRYPNPKYYIITKQAFDRLGYQQVSGYTFNFPYNKNLKNEKGCYFFDSFSSLIASLVHLLKKHL